ncbi:uncharacterized protein CCOS01_02021 [Colletotrichum costaricense]|uniref:Uncharacterized protein n=1 Tax=Colletotrichum costaricense TaxID=1209916 RepID=A0AAI9Z705_9PEZI|nr:uncharacterized protein CCOS01_02021 [Colletotrichum costaricense]KAK1536701.1 hypothetical protein CCOS01_02021 [Colletotrichum costaricense]
MPGLESENRGRNDMMGAGAETVKEISQPAVAYLASVEPSFSACLTLLRASRCSYVCEVATCGGVKEPAHREKKEPTQPLAAPATDRTAPAPTAPPHRIAVRPSAGSRPVASSHGRRSFPPIQCPSYPIIPIRSSPSTTSISRAGCEKNTSHHYIRASGRFRKYRCCPAQERLTPSHAPGLNPESPKLTELPSPLAR